MEITQFLVQKLTYQAARGKSSLTPPPPCICIAWSTTLHNILGAAILIIAIWQIRSSHDWRWAYANIYSLLSSLSSFRTCQSYELRGVWAVYTDRWRYDIPLVGVEQLPVKHQYVVTGEQLTSLYLVFTCSRMRLPKGLRFDPLDTINSIQRSAIPGMITNQRFFTNQGIWLNIKHRDDDGLNKLI